MEIFSLVKEKMLVTVSLRQEIHGEDRVNAYDIRLSGRFANSAILPKLDKELLSVFYTDEKQRELEEFKRKLRFPRINPKFLPWDLEIPRVILHMHDAHDADADFLIGDNTADNFKFLPLDGGTVEFSLRIKTKETTEDQVLKLLRANGQEIIISMECAPLEEKLDNYKQAELIAKEPKSEAVLAAEAMFKPAPTVTTAPVADVADAVAAVVASIDKVTETKKRTTSRKKTGATVIE